ncbi:UDP-3-O-acyl-N-acetylglucosamine deacetylase [Rhodobacteraceae bacterium CCMM004]|nr:UDP-3-O-acyl-N-acetylglucosamine deacetylase [Rhodobacteraceae bacterium CCMM004]
MQTTINETVSFDGVGLHTGVPVRMTLRPAPAGFGIAFRRVDLGGQPRIPAVWDAVVPGALCTKIAAPSGASVSTIEHIMAAAAGCGVHNLTIDIDGPEVPVMDGSSAVFVAEILRVGLRALDAPIRAIEVLDRVEVRNGDAMARLDPCDHLEMAFHIDFADAAIGRQDKTMSLANGAFVHELCDSRTFCRAADIDAMRAQGLALGGSLENAVVVKGAEVLSPGGLRHHDEAVRHKMLDALGDLALAGAPLLAHYTGVRAGHAMTNALLRALFARPNACRIVTASPALAARLPGAGLSRDDAPRVV